ncbi:outer membrane biogenesis protein BamB [Pirellula sp. SH-Sr6A]|uniref:outer membrane protein assembly factor BamB family protein n=1 Tax=Pirellula sp. SH-Sr6A TaxID=1632865 RepID=UPI00078D4600|nr:PQQ-binding-like beta-propeller repeat protein [Pirellula sp. SH-Sr6A]AMV35518.1 outer membrane biogenesis protein BamB [Pirellula sp. SH-Sr6A]
MAATAFIRLLESRGLLDPEIIQELYRQVETSKVRVTPEAIAKLLVENGQLTRFQATKLITELNETLDRSANDPTTALRGGRPIDSPVPNDHDSVEDLLPDDMDEVDVEVVSDSKDGSESDENETPVEIVATSAPVSRSDLDVDDFPKRVISGGTPTKSAWESFRILGVGFFLLLLLVALVPLLWWVTQGTAKEAFDRAESTYEARDYETAAKLFTDFAYKFPRDDRASEAKVRAVLATIREDAEKVADPSTAATRAQELLPTIAGEDAVGVLRPDMSDMLLRIADKFLSRIDNTESLEERQKLLDRLSEHMALIRDPRYIGPQERTQNSLRIQGIEEGQSRAARDIQRGQDLLVAIDSMTKSNEAKEVNKTYTTRRDLVRKYPVLETDKRLNELLAAATLLQKDLVQSVSQPPVLSTEEGAPTSVRRIVFTNRNGQGNASDTEPVFFKLKGSLVALRSGDGSVLWRKFIGYDWTGGPQSISSTGDSDVLVHFPENNSVQRLKADDGSLVWEAKFSSKVHRPQIDGDDLFVSTQDGQAYCLDAATGTVRWGKKVPQGADVPMGGAFGKRMRYVVGDHSNLYAFTRAGGQCEEVEYIGHNPGTIAIAPIWVLNHLMVFENTGPDYSYLKVYTTNDEGLNIQPSGQIPIRFKGHFVVDPQVDGRRFVVTTNLGEVAIFEVDVSSNREKVQKMAGSIEKETNPIVNWPLMIGTDLYLASNRIGLYQIQVSSQKLNRSWQKEDGDSFVAKPIQAGNSVIHARMVRGNLGVRVASINAQSGELNWETDVGVPVTALAGDASRWTALTAQGAVYQFTPEQFTNPSPVSQIENFGRNQRLMKFISSVTLQDGKLVVFNAEKENQLLLIDPSRSRGVSRLVSIDFGGATAANDPIAVGNLVVVPLTNSQLVLLDPDNAQIVGVPFQPTISAGEQPRWLNPVLLPDKQSIVIADEARSIYKLSTGKQLRTILQQDLDRKLKGRLSVLNNTVVAVSTNDAGDQLDFFDGIELKLFASLPMEGRFAWGPYSVQSGEVSLVLAYSEIEGLVAADDKGKKRWAINLDRIQLRGRPAIVGSDLLIGTATGDLLRISPTEGKIAGKTTIGEPVYLAPIVEGNAAVVAGDEGTVIAVPVPSANE